MDSRSLNKGSSPFFPGWLQGEDKSLSTALDAVKYSTVWLRNLVFLEGTLPLIHFAMAISSFVGFSSGCISSASYQKRIFSFIKFNQQKFSIQKSIKEKGNVSREDSVLHKRSNGGFTEERSLTYVPLRPASLNITQTKLYQKLSS